jgi:hypothetical protein
MNERSAARILASAPAAALPGTWKLVRGRAVTLRPATDGILRIAHGRVWATVDGPHGRAPDDSGDHVLQAGRSMYVRAGQRVVIEAWNASGASYFAWDPVHATALAAAPRLNTAVVLQPLADLRMALGPGRSRARPAGPRAGPGGVACRARWRPAAVHGASPRSRRLANGGGRSTMRNELR